MTRLGHLTEWIGFYQYLAAFSHQMISILWGYTQYYITTTKQMQGGRAERLSSRASMLITLFTKRPIPKCSARLPSGSPKLRTRPRFEPRAGLVIPPNLPLLFLCVEEEVHAVRSGPTVLTVWLTIFDEMNIERVFNWWERMPPRSEIIQLYGFNKSREMETRLMWAILCSDQISSKSSVRQTQKGCDTSLWKWNRIEKPHLHYSKSYPSISC